MHQAELELTAGWYGFGGQATSCLSRLAYGSPQSMVDDLTLEDVQADSTEAIDVGVVDLGEEADLGWCHGVVVGQEELELEDAT